MKVSIYIQELDTSLEEDGLDGYVEFEGECIYYQPEEKPGSVNPGCSEEFEFEITWDKEKFSTEENNIIENYVWEVHCKLVEEWRK